MVAINCELLVALSYERLQQRLYVLPGFSFNKENPCVRNTWSWDKAANTVEVLGTAGTPKLALALFQGWSIIKRAMSCAASLLIVRSFSKLYSWYLCNLFHRGSHIMKRYIKTSGYSIMNAIMQEYDNKCSVILWRMLLTLSFIGANMYLLLKKRVECVAAKGWSLSSFFT